LLPNWCELPALIFELLFTSAFWPSVSDHRIQLTQKPVSAQPRDDDNSHILPGMFPGMVLAGTFLQLALLSGGIARTERLCRRQRCYETRQTALDPEMVSVVPPESNLLDPWEYNREFYKNRNETERLIRCGNYILIQRLDKKWTGYATTQHCLTPCAVYCSAT